MYEVELKFPLPDPQPVLQQLADWGVQAEPALAQCDLYLAHPQRSFAETNEALRIRSVGNWNCVTYKGPVLDKQTKMRREIEIAFTEGSASAQEMRELWETLGFRAVREVRKQRTPYHLHRHGRDLEFALDEVAGLGTFAEIETLAGEAEKDAARHAILTLAEELGLSAPQPKSYLSMLLLKDAAAPKPAS